MATEDMNNGNNNIARGTQTQNTPNNLFNASVEGINSNNRNTHPYSIEYDFRYKPARIIGITHNDNSGKNENLVRNMKEYQDMEFDNRLLGVRESYLRKAKLESERLQEKVYDSKIPKHNFEHLIDEYAENNKDILKKFEYIETLKRLKGL